MGAKGKSDGALTVEFDDDGGTGGGRDLDDDLEREYMRDGRKKRRWRKRRMGEKERRRSIKKGKIVRRPTRRKKISIRDTKRKR